MARDPKPTFSKPTEPPPAPPRGKGTAIWRLMRLDKPIGTLLLLWPTLSALWLAAHGPPRFSLLVVFVVGTFLMRSAGCVINDVFDRRFDRHVERTAERPLTRGEIDVVTALWVFAILVALALLLVLQLQNQLLLWLSLPALLVAMVYPLCKRFLALPQAVLGVAFGFGIPMAFAAVDGSVPSLAWLLWLANVFWTMAYDTEYAMVDRDDDRKLGLKTSAITFGRYDVAAVMICYGIYLLLTAALVISVCGWSWLFALAWLVALRFVYRHYRWIRDRSREGCFRAFRHNNYVGGVLFAGVVLALQS